MYSCVIYVLLCMRLFWESYAPSCVRACKRNCVRTCDMFAILGLQMCMQFMRAYGCNCLYLCLCVCLYVCRGWVWVCNGDYERYKCGI